MTTDRAAVARVLDQIADHLELKGENPFRIRAFRSSARVVSGLSAEPAEMLADGTLAEVRGVGPAILSVIRDLVERGRSRVLEELRDQISPGLVEMLGISGLGVAKVRGIHQRLGIDSIPELEAAARDGRLAALPGFGPKTAENVLRGIGYLRRASTHRLCHHAAEEAERLRKALEHVAGVSRALVAGEVRRRCELVGEIVLVLVAEVPPVEVFRALSQLPGVDEFGGQDERRASLQFAGGEAAQIVVNPPVNLGAVLLHATGSGAHLAQLVAFAEAQGLALQGAALWRGSEFVPTPDEETVYRALGIPWIPPELREGLDELELARRGALPRLLEPGDLAGLLHCHTEYSDGTGTVRELALACRMAGYGYVGITDHSGAAAFAGGLAVEEVERQWAEVDAVNAELEGVRVLKGIESDILADGGLDYDETTLARFDFVIGSIHSRLGMDGGRMTARVLRALEHRCLTILGHPTGRLLLTRDPYPIDLDAVFAKAAEQGVAIEINADPERLDLDWRVLRRARSRGVLISVGADAHNVAGLSNVTWGVGIARKGGLGPGDILNTRPVEEFLAFARRRREVAAR